MKVNLMVINESPAPYFYEQMKIREAVAHDDWREMNSMPDYYEDILLSCPTLADYLERERWRAFYNMTQNCIRALNERCLMEVS